MSDKQAFKLILLAMCAGFVVGSGIIIILANLLGWYK